MSPSRVESAKLSGVLSTVKVPDDASAPYHTDRLRHFDLLQLSRDRVVDNELLSQHSLCHHRIRGVYRIEDPVRRQKFIESMVKEISALTEMGTISHLHTAEELKDKFGVDITVKTSVH